ncbi:MAG: hypothetical protein ACOH2K_11780 [Burkholderiaceae bacterium]
MTAGIIGILSYRLAIQNHRELKGDEVLVPGILHNPTLSHPDHENCVLQTTIINKSKCKAYINGVRVFRQDNTEIDVDWSDHIDPYGNPQGGGAQIIAITDASSLCVRRLVRGKPNASTITLHPYQGAAALDTDPDYELDAFLRSAGRPDLLCDVKVWLPCDPSTDGRMEVVVMGVDARRAHPEGLATFISDKDVEAAGLRFEAREVLVRSSRSKGPRKAGGTKLTITHVGSLRIETGKRARDESDQIKGAPQWLQFVLSELSYGRPQRSSTLDFRGNRSVHGGRTIILRMVRSEGVTCELELEQHWTWTCDADTRVSATSTPVLNVLNIGQDYKTSVEELTNVADDACVLLSLAARHRVVVHTVVSVWDGLLVREWRNPLARIRTSAEEEACGPLIGVSELEGYFSQVSVFWGGLDTGERDSIRLAVFAVHPTTDRTLENGFLAMFSVLEGLALRWGRDTGTLRDKVNALLRLHPVHIGGLWPLFDTEVGVGLYWIRNELAHGRRVGRFAPGALVLAQDHLQLWLESMLLAVMGYRPQPHGRDRLREQILPQRPQVTEMQEKLRDSARRL